MQTGKEIATAINGFGSTLLQITFLVLKLTGVIEWSWWWVMAPTWIPIAFLILVIIGVSVVGAFCKGRRS